MTNFTKTFLLTIFIMFFTLSCVTEDDEMLDDPSTDQDTIAIGTDQKQQQPDTNQNTSDNTTLADNSNPPDQSHTPDTNQQPDVDNPTPVDNTPQPENDVPDEDNYINVMPEIVSVSPENEAVNVATSTVIEVVFSETVTEDSLTTAFSLQDENSNTITCSLSWDDTAKKATFTPESALQENTQYTITITKDIVDTEGLNMAHEFSAVFTTSGPFAVITTLPTADETDVYNHVAPAIRFSHKIDEQSVDYNNFIVKDNTDTAIDGIIKMSHFPDNRSSIIRFIPDEPLSFNAQYTIEVHTDITSVNGASLEEALIYSFTTSTDKLFYDGFENDYFKELNNDDLDDYIHGMTHWTIRNTGIKTNLWEMGAPTHPNINTAKSGNHVLATRLNSDYPYAVLSEMGISYIEQPSVRKLIHSVPIHIGSNGATIEFYAYVSTEQCGSNWCDGMIVQLWEWNEGAQDFYYLSAGSSMPIDGDLVNDFKDDTGKNTSGVAGKSTDNTYTKFTVNIPAGDFGNKKVGLGFRFFSDTETVGPGVYIDDVTIRDN